MYLSSLYLQSVSLGKSSGTDIKNRHTDYDRRAPPVSIDQVVSDFDNVAFHVSTPETKTKILISISLKCYRELLEYGAQQVLEREYGPYIVTPEAGYDFSVLIDLENLPTEPGRRDGAWNEIYC